MNDEPRWNERIHEAIEAYRPGRDDPSDPALAPLVERLAADAELARTHQRLQRLDAALGDAIRDVPVPEGLGQRILDRLGASAHAPETPGDVAVQAMPEADEAVDVLPSPRMSARRRWLVSATTAAVAASLAVGTFFLFQPRGYSEDEVLDVAVRLFDAPEPEVGRELSDAERLGVEGFPLGIEVAVLSVRQWRPIHGFLDRQGVAYDLRGRGGARATLYVVPYGGAVAGLGVTPPDPPTRTTGGRCAGAWQTGGFLYVLVVEGDKRTYRGFLTPGRPLA